MPPGVTLLNHFHNDYGLGNDQLHHVACRAASRRSRSRRTATANARATCRCIKSSRRCACSTASRSPGFKYHKLQELARFMESRLRVPDPSARADHRRERVLARIGHPHARDAHRPAHVRSGAGGTRRRTICDFVYGKHSGLSVVEAALRKNEAALKAGRHGRRQDSGQHACSRKSSGSGRSAPRTGRMQPRSSTSTMRT